MKRAVIGRFDQSFVIRMIRDFFLALLIVVVVELGIRFLLAYYNYQHDGKSATVEIARNLSDDIKAIMLNSGGPVAARTIYPILKRNYHDLGFEIAATPSHITRASIEKAFKFEPHGIQPRWPKGKHHTQRVAIRAEQFCTRCHVAAAVGDTLGTVEVRNYFSTHLKLWWQDVRLASVIGMGNIIIHTLVLFFLLRVRMEPLLGLRSLISTLSRGKLDLSYRAEIKSSDEFGELALALNSFLERISLIISDLHRVLTRMMTVNDRLKQVSGQMGDHLSDIQTQTQTAIKKGTEVRKGQAMLSKEVLQTLQSLAATLSIISENGNIPGEHRENMKKIVRKLGDASREAEQASGKLDEFSENLFLLSDRIREHSHFMKELGLLEEHIKVVAENGQALLNSLSGHGKDFSAEPTTAIPEKTATAEPV